MKIPVTDFHMEEPENSEALKQWSTSVLSEVKAMTIVADEQQDKKMLILGIIGHCKGLDFYSQMKNDYGMLNFM